MAKGQIRAIELVTIGTKFRSVYETIDPAFLNDGEALCAKKFAQEVCLFSPSTLFV